MGREYCGWQKYKFTLPKTVKFPYKNEPFLHITPKTGKNSHEK